MNVKKTMVKNAKKCTSIWYNKTYYSIKSLAWIESVYLTQGSVP